MSYCSRKTLLKNVEADYSGDCCMGVWQQGRTGLNSEYAKEEWVFIAKEKDGGK